MNEYFVLFLSAILSDNFVLVRCLGLCPFIGTSRKMDVALGMGISTSCVIIVTSILTSVINNFVLIPLNITYLQILLFVFTISIVVQSIEIIIYNINPKLYQMFGNFLPLITTNCIVLGVSIENANKNYGFLKSVTYGFSVSIGFLIAIILFSAIREKLTVANIPYPFKGLPINLITVGLTSMAFMGFTKL